MGDGEIAIWRVLLVSMLHSQYWREFFLLYTDCSYKFDCVCSNK